MLGIGKLKREKQKKIQARATHTVVRRASQVQASKPDSVTRVLFYLSISDMSQAAKEAWASLLPHMTDDQRSRLAALMETKFLDQATHGIDEHLEQELAHINAKYANAQT